MKRGLGNQYVVGMRRALTQAPASCGGARPETDFRCAESSRPPSDIGEPLSRDLCLGLEGVFGTDLGHVRLHAGPQADADARRLDAAAFTAGRDIFFRSGAFAPATREGLRLLAHEVTHTVQLRRTEGGTDSGSEHRRDPVSDPGDPAEREAELVAGQLVNGVAHPSLAVSEKTQSAPASTGLGTKVAVLRSPATDNISRRTSWYGDLDERMLGRDLLDRARAGDFPFVQEAFDALGSSDRDDVAYEFCVAATYAEIQAMTASAAGRAVIDRLFDELTTGTKDADEQREADRLLKVKAARMTPEEFGTAIRTAKIFPFRLPGFTVYDSAPISAERRPGGRIRVHMPTRVLGTAMFRADTGTLPADTFINGIELPETEIVGVRMYDLGGAVVYRPALFLLELSNETSTTVLSKMAEAIGIGLTLGAGSLVGLGVEATMAARVLLWADRAAFVLGTLTSVIKEHRGEILAHFGDTGREFLRYVDFVQSATAIYGFARVALSLGQLVNGLRIAYGNLRSAAKATKEGGTGGVTGELTRSTDELLRQADGIQGAKVAATAPPTTAPPTTAPAPTPVPPGFGPDARVPRAGARRVYSQGEAPTCGPVACGMVVDTMGQPHDLTELVKVAGPKGTPMEVVLDLMRRHRIDAELRTGLTVDDLARATSSRAGGNPAIAVLREPPGASHPLHAVVVDGVTERLGQRVVAVRNPQRTGTQYFELADKFAKDFIGQAITVNYSY
ncbi:eCIS core domain-containing protein [Streptomyces afghaniensis]|uniref:eCIS core domain-containing protein n=1 Tax=Streptomyces afghaniensis TaxID=66865 RepID=UPI0024693D4C|nr:DUF4157 domain-containing protein [Streptomyces afghaniensis]